MLYCRKILLSSTLKHISEYQSVIIYRTSSSIKPQCRQFSRTIRVTKIPPEIIKQRGKLGFLRNMWLKFVISSQKYQLMELGGNLYTDIADKLNYPVFFKEFSMPDTFYSWFLITELHVWMLMVRYMAEGSKGKLVRKSICDAMWNDVAIKVDKLGIMTSKVKNTQILCMAEQFNAAVIAYDEGITSDDKVLAGALWRRYFCSECNNPEQLEKLLLYVRKQTNILDRIPSDDIFDQSSIKWIDIKSLR